MFIGNPAGEPGEVFKHLLIAGVEDMRPIEMGQDPVPGIVVHIAADLGPAFQDLDLVSVVSQFPGGDSAGKASSDHHCLACSRGVLHS